MVAREKSKVEKLESLPLGQSFPAVREWVTGVLGSPQPSQGQGRPEVARLPRASLSSLSRLL